MKKIILLVAGLFFFITQPVDAQTTAPKLWTIQSIDTMKYSRDLARAEAKNPDFATEITRQTADIASLGVTHIAISTPYDDEFIPFLAAWVKSARAHGLKVWFRGNFSGWENWYGYPDVTRAEHIRGVERFIVSNPDLFEDGDIFSPCHECENGGDGDPRLTKDVAGYRDFLVAEYQATKAAFTKIGKSVASNFFSMNYDIAKLIMDKNTVKQMDSIIVLDHYVANPLQLSRDIEDISKSTGAKVVLGEFGVPIPDIHGPMSQNEQALWLTQALDQLVQTQALIGLNYWVNIGGSTPLWDESHSPRPAVSVLQTYYHPEVVTGSIKDKNGRPIPGAVVTFLGRRYAADDQGRYQVPLLPNRRDVYFSSPGFKSKLVTISPQALDVSVALDREFFGILYKIRFMIESFIENLSNK